MGILDGGYLGMLPDYKQAAVRCRSILTGPYSAAVKLAARYSLARCLFLKLSRGVGPSSRMVSECLAVTRVDFPESRLPTGGIQAKVGLVEVETLKFAGQPEQAAALAAKLVERYPQSLRFAGERLTDDPPQKK